MFFFFTYDNWSYDNLGQYCKIIGFIKLQTPDIEDDIYFLKEIYAFQIF